MPPWLNKQWFSNPNFKGVALRKNMGSYISPPDQRSNSTKRAVPNYELHILFGDWKVTPHRKLTWKSKQWRLARYITFLFKMKVFHGYVLPRLNGIYNSNSLFQSTHQGWRLFLWHEVLLPWRFSRRGFSAVPAGVVEKFQLKVTQNNPKLTHFAICRPWTSQN